MSKASHFYINLATVAESNALDVAEATRRRGIDFMGRVLRAAGGGIIMNGYPARPTMVLTKKPPDNISEVILLYSRGANRC